jgi:molybdate transport system substrate-binding protein
MRMNRRSLLLLPLPLQLPLFASAKPAALTVAAAADLRFALDALLPLFRAQHPSTTVQAVLGASGKLATQIRNGAPFDVFLSADIAFAQSLHDDGLSSRPQPYAVGRLASWSMNAQLGALPLADLLRHASLQRFAIANPAHAPYGMRAMEALRALGLADAMAPKLVLGDNVAQAAAFIESGAAQAGLVAHSLLLAPALQGKGAWQMVPEQLHSRLVQALTITQRGASQPLAAAFVDFMASPAGRAVLRQHGFSTEGL